MNLKTNQQELPRGWSGRFALVEAFEQSGTSLSVFCRERGLAVSTLHAWRRKYQLREDTPQQHSAEDNAPSFVELAPLSTLDSTSSGPLQKDSLPKPTHLHLEFGDGLTLSFPQSHPPFEVAAFVRGFLEAY